MEIAVHHYLIDGVIDFSLRQLCSPPSRHHMVIMDISQAPSNIQLTVPSGNPITINLPISALIVLDAYQGHEDDWHTFYHYQVMLHK